VFIFHLGRLDWLFLPRRRQARNAPGTQSPENKDQIEYNHLIIGSFSNQYFLNSGELSGIKAIYCII
ncbi:MAG: hypothetical protein WCQ26_11785, partial [Pseudanabaena sp. ELA748]